MTHVLGNTTSPTCFIRYCVTVEPRTLRWRHNDHAGVSNHQPRGCLLNRLFRRKSEKTSKLRVTGLCAGNSPGTDEFPAQMASYAENVSIWWRHHDIRTPNIRKPHHPDVFWQERNFSIILMLKYSDIRASVSEQQFGASNNQFNCENILQIRNSQIDCLLNINRFIPQSIKHIVFNALHDLLS